MKVYKEIDDVKDFEFWSGACHTVKDLGLERAQRIWNQYAEISDELVSATEINDFFWFDTDMIAYWLGYENWEDFLERKDRDEK